VCWKSSIIEKAWKDPAFKQALLKDPHAALRNFNIPMPDGVKLHVHEETASDLHMVLPPDPSKSELSDQDLDAVAGGGTLDSWGPGFC